MKLLQVVLCVVLALLGRVVTYDAEFEFIDRNQDYVYRRMTHERTEKFAFNKTVFPAPGFDPGADVDTLYGATDGFLFYDPTGLNPLKYNATKIINTLTYRSMQERVKISFAYKNRHHKSLIDVFKCTLRGDFRKVMLALMTPIPKYYAEELKTALYSWRIAPLDIVDIILSLSNDGINALFPKYFTQSHHRLDQDVEDLLTGDFRTLIKALLKNERPLEQEAGSNAVMADIQSLGGDSTKPANVTKFITIFTTRSWIHLQEVVRLYNMTFHQEIEYTFKTLEEGDFKDAILAIVDRARDRASYYASRLRYHVGRNSLIRTLVVRSEIDLREIQEYYDAHFETPLYVHLSARIKDMEYLTALESLIR